MAISPSAQADGWTPDQVRAFERPKAKSLRWSDFSDKGHEGCARMADSGGWETLCPDLEALGGSR